MGFVRADPAIEAWLDRDAAAWRMLSDADYKAHVPAWKGAFESALSNRSTARHVEGPRALDRLESLLPCSVLVFNLPGYRHQPTPPFPSAPTVVYQAEALRAVASSVADPRELILADEILSFTCLFSHEAEWVRAPWLFERDSMRPA